MCALVCSPGQKRSAQPSVTRPNQTLRNASSFVSLSAKPEPTSPKNPVW